MPQSGSASESEPRSVVIIGAGVIGLTIAHVLSTRFQGGVKITIVARDMPDDLTSQAFASPWAGANWSPFGYEEKSYKRELKTFNRFWDMQSTGLVHVVPYRIFVPDEPTDSDTRPYFKDLVRNFRPLSQEELPEGMKAGVIFDTITVNPEEYLPWLKSQLSTFGVAFVRRKLHTLDDAADLVGVKGVIINATALGARSLVGVEDKMVYPIRGQTIIAHAPEIKECVALPLEGAGGDVTYMIPRPSPHGHVLVGGTYQKNNWDTSVDFDTAQRMWNTLLKFVPTLKSNNTKVICHNVGLRPAREGGPRIELELVTFPLRRDFMHGSANDRPTYKMPVIHAYGFGGAGYQGSWGAAEEVADIFKDVYNNA
ncbi:nucleotide-binding domain-containing protein [Cristinia sonorae]|uniref:Nucleotide-binding domain-containing protein n=1 Tax=Cristinia sonorae TaxID=1940300 RepID=A0A8K0UP75_9AGAR|nr:nucleotide-binding domain-containing protein [Cristinia sonorae]